MLTTLASLKSELGISGADNDDDLTAVIRQQSAAIESYCGRKFVQRVVTEVFRLSIGQPALPLSVLPVVNIISVTENGTLLDVDEYELDEPANGGDGSGLLYRLDTEDERVDWAVGKTVIVYDAGYVLPGVTGYDLPYDVERACLDLCVRTWSVKGRDPTLRSYENPDVERFAYTAADSVKTVGGLPEDVVGRLNRYRMLFAG